MAKDKSDFLRFSAYSMKDLITRKLSENSSFTDQIYEGSNLAILIDLVSYMYQCLVYQLNNAASESMFADTQIFENINRLVNLLGYNVRGCYPAALKTYVTKNETSERITLLPYTRFDTGKTDSRGNKIYFSVGKDVPMLDSDDHTDVVFYNGQFRMYGTVFTASGSQNETFALDIASDFDAYEYVANDFIDVYVQPNGSSEIQAWTCDQDGIFLKRSASVDQVSIDNSFYSGEQDAYYTVKLGQNKRYEIKFGDGIVGRRLNSGDRVIVMYLDTNGPDGKIDISDVDFTAITLEHSAVQFGMSEDTYKKMFQDTEYKAADNVTVSPNANSITGFTPEQSVSGIRQAAPNYFKTGNRLITARDYEYYVKNSEKAKTALGGYVVADVKCMNNTEFVATFYKWLFKQGLLAGLSNGGRHYFDQTFWNRADYKKIDPADCNNTYLWIKTDNPAQGYVQDEYNITDFEDSLNDAMKSMKTMTTEIQVVKPVLVNFDICANHDLDYIREHYMKSGPNFDSDAESYIEITLDDDTTYTSTQIQSQVEKIITGKFNVNVCRLGQNISYGEMLDSIYAISGVKSVRTICAVEETQTGVKRVVGTYDGLSFASWSPILDDNEAIGVDLDVGSSGRRLEDFQFPIFIGGNTIGSRITVIKRSMTAINTIKS